MGSGTDYSGQINNSLAQSNTPKSSLSQEYSGLLGGVAPGILNSLLNTQNLGNSFLNVNGASSPYNGQQQQPIQHSIFDFFGGQQGQQGQGQQNIPSGGDAQIEPQLLSAVHGTMTRNGYQPGTDDDSTGNGFPNWGQQFLPSDNGATPSGTATLNPAAGGKGWNEQQFFNQGQGLGIGQGQQGGINLQGFQAAMPQLMQMLQGNNLSNINPAISQLLQGIGGQPQQVNPMMLGQSGFQQQQANPGMIQNPGFQAQSAQLGGINTGIGLSGGSLDSFNAIANILKQQSDAGVADTRERFTGLGGSRGTGASYAEGQQRAALIPQLQQALSNSRNQEVSNQLQSAGLQSQNALQNAGMMNQYGLGGAQLDVQRQGQNVSNLLNAAGINNQYGLGGAQLNAQLGQGNQQTGLQAQGMNQQAGLQGQQNNNNLLAQLLGQQGSNFNSINQSNLGQNNLLSQLAQANSSGQNQFNLATAGMNQAAAQQQVQNQLQTLMSLFSGGLGLAGAGIPGGSANVNVGNGQQNSFGSSLAGIASILGAF